MNSLLSSRCVWLKCLLVIAAAGFAPSSFQYAQASEPHEAQIERQSQSAASMEVRSWELEAFFRARQIRLGQRRLKRENVNQASIAEVESGVDSFAAQQALLESARGQPGLTGLEPLPVSLFVP